MPNLYSWAESNIYKTWILISSFLVFVIAMGWVFSYVFESRVILLVAVLYAVLNALISYQWSDKIVIKMHKAREIKKEDYPEIFDIVENLCITAGLPRPRIYIMSSLQPNAFATGKDPKHAAVVLTEGLIKKLDHSELEGVIAHELSHIKNRDILLQTVVVILVGVVAMLSDLFLRMMFSGLFSSRDSREGGGFNVIIMAIALIGAILAPLAAVLIQLAISRKREFLADASGALLTRYPEGLARALEKIALDPTPMKEAKNSAAHLFFANPFKGQQRNNWLHKLFMTHPPVEERIKALRSMM